jgi:DNA-binding response OmpR family regulator
MTGSSPRVLVVEDEPHIRELVCLHLSHEGYSCEGVGDGQQALKVAEADRFDLMVLDVMIPGLDGLSLCRAIRNGQTNRDVPILMLTARRDEADKVVGLESGADDYLTKPFGVRELVARARALLRRPRQPAGAALTDGARADDGVVRIQGIEVDPAKRRVSVDGRDTELTDQEFRLLHLLATHAGIVFSREALLAKIWRGDTFVTVRSVDTLVKRLRRRIEPDPANPRYLLTVWGVGYKFELAGMAGRAPTESPAGRSKDRVPELQPGCWFGREPDDIGGT